MLSECRVERSRHKHRARVTAGCQFVAFHPSETQTGSIFFAKTYHGTQYKCESQFSTTSPIFSGSIGMPIISVQILGMITRNA